MAILSTEQPDQLKTRFRFVHGLRFEIFYALQTLTDDESRVHATWKANAKTALPDEFWSLFAAIGGAPVFWALIADACETLDPHASYAEVTAHLQAQDDHAFRQTVLIGALHDQERVDALVRGECGLEDIVARAPEDKLPWFDCLGIYPYDREAPAAVGLRSLVAAPAEFKRAALRSIDLFWRAVFAATWAQVEPRLVQSLQVKARLFESSPLAEFIDQTLVRLEVDEENRVLRARRGGCVLPFDEIESICVLPSLFNDARLWTMYERDDRLAVFLPYFDPSIDLDQAAEGAEPTLDPALVFKALGDNTRYAIARLIGEQSRTAAELAKTLGVSKPTISHHVNLLREAGLLDERYASGSVQLTLKRNAIESLSTAAVGALFRGAGGAGE